jgi:hypothetical protein
VRLAVTSWSFPACTLPECQSIARAIGIWHLDLGLLHGAALDADRCDRSVGAAEAVRALGISARTFTGSSGQRPR